MVLPEAFIQFRAEKGNSAVQFVAEVVLAFQDTDRDYKYPLRRAGLHSTSGCILGRECGHREKAGRLGPALMPVQVGLQTNFYARLSKQRVITR